MQTLKKKKNLLINILISYIIKIKLLNFISQ
jgi:hypothetical protein